MYAVGSRSRTETCRRRQRENFPPGGWSIGWMWMWSLGLIRSCQAPGSVRAPHETGTTEIPSRRDLPRARRAWSSRWVFGEEKQAAARVCRRAPATVRLSRAAAIRKKSCLHHDWQPAPRRRSQWLA